MTTYTADLDHRSLAYMCSCGDCDWRGDVSALDEIGDCSLTAGDPSPAGRCPECGTLAYPDEEQDHIIDRAPATLKASRAMLAALEALTAWIPPTPADYAEKGAAAFTQEARFLIDSQNAARAAIEAAQAAGIEVRS